jgi:hypothetical protein
MSFSHSPRIATSGLVFYLDAANPQSYPGSGTTWRDLSGNGNNGTLNNSPGFNSDNGGSIVFDGSDDYVTFPVITNTIFSIDFWYKMGGNDGTYGYFASSGSNGLAISEGGGGDGLVYGKFYYWQGNANVLADIPSTTDWNHICVLINTSTNNIDLYGNGIILGNFTVSATTPSVSDIGRFVGGNSHFLKGNLASYKIYNRALSASEVLQNYESTKARFGL